MRILVIDDSGTNLLAAEAQLKEHQLSTADTYDHGESILQPKPNSHEAEQILAQRGITYSRENSREYHKALEAAMDETIPPLPFDVVLVDLLMPASANQQGLNEHIDKEMPVGIFLALLAAKRGAKYVAVFTDSDHHSHPASACFDIFNPKGEQEPAPIIVEGAKLFLCNNRGWIRNFYPEDLATEMDFDDWGDPKYGGKGLPSVRTKNWAGLLRYMLKESSYDDTKA